MPWQATYEGFSEKLSSLELEERLFRDFFMNPKSLNCIADVDNSSFKLYSPLWLELLKMNHEELVSTPFIELVVEEDRAWTIDIWSRRHSPDYMKGHPIAINAYQGNGEVFYVRWADEAKTPDGKYMLCNAGRATQSEYESWKMANL